MHSGRIRTARTLTIGWGVYLPGVVHPPGWCTCPGGCTCQGVYLPRYPPPVNRMTDRCKNITLPQTSFAGGNNDSSYSVSDSEMSRTITFVTGNIRKLEEVTQILGKSFPYKVLLSFILSELSPSPELCFYL